MSRWWLLVSLPLALLAVAAIARTVRGLVRMARASVVASVPLGPPQRVTFDQPGEYAVSLETGFGGQFRVRGVGPFSTMQFALVNDRGVTIVSRPPLSQTRVSSFDRVRIEVARLTVPAAGTYTLHTDAAEAITEATGRDRIAIVISHPIGGRIAMYVIALLVLGMTLIGAVVATGIAWRGGTLGPS